MDTQNEYMKVSAMELTTNRFTSYFQLSHADTTNETTESANKFVWSLNVESDHTQVMRPLSLGPVPTT